MLTKLVKIITLTAITLLPCQASELTREYFLRFPARDADSAGQIDKLAVTVSCSWISELKNVPELQNIQMGYDIPTINELSATPRLGAAAATLSRWSGVIGVKVPVDADARSCFEVKACAIIREDVRGNEEVEKCWTNSQLGLPK